ncbi:MAG: hypothetical protein MK137_07200 [Rickettsiales bacterium]|nr:hypothetical protein [Rickettsiales bacterium]
MRHIIRSIAACIVFLFVFTSISFADTKRDLETISKTISFIKNGPKGEVTMDVLFDPANPDSVAHADGVVELLSNGVGSRVKLTGKKVSSVNDITSRIIFVTRGVNNMYQSIIDKAAQNNGVTISTDENCLGNGCVVVVKTLPSVDIFVSIDAAEKTGTEFATAFSMMITKK